MEADPNERLIAHIRAQEEEITNRWAARVNGDPRLKGPSNLTRDEFKDNIAAILEGLCTLLRGGAIDEEMLEGIAAHGHNRWKQSFSLEELIRDWGHLNAELVYQLHRYCKIQDCGSDFTAQTFDRLASFVTTSLGASAAEYERLHRFEAASRYRDLERMTQPAATDSDPWPRLLREFAHDMRGSLTALSGAGSCMLQDMPRERLARLSDMLREGVNAVTEMLESLQELARLEAGLEERKLSRVALGPLAEDLRVLFAPMAAEEGLELVLEGDPDLVIETDRQKLRRILQNLLVNALKYTDEGTVALRWKSTENGRLRIEVEDSGPGLQVEQGSLVAQQINHPDVEKPAREAVDSESDTHAQAGEGIGLTIVKRLCEMLNITITLESRRGRGTRFTLRLPLDYGLTDASSEAS